MAGNSPGMRARIAVMLAGVAGIMICAETAHATCSFDAGSGLMSITQGGGGLRVGSGGAILFGGSPCGTATTSNTMRIVVNGSATLRDYLQLQGNFAPGRDDGAETGLAEIEIELVGFTGNDDEIFIIGTGAADTWRFSAGAIDLNGDGDDDMTAPSDGLIRTKGLGGNDVIDAGAYAGTAELRLRGGPGNDTITGSPGGDDILGEAGDDILSGGAGADDILDGIGSDRVHGGPGNDDFFAEGAADGSDDFRGGGGLDRVSYLGRVAGVRVSIDNVADDGAPGENDNVHLDVEIVQGGEGDDILIGSSGNDHLDGATGNDEIYGGAGDDVLSASGFAFEESVLMGEDGDDELYGGEGADVLDGGAGVDLLRGITGNDTFFNADGFADTVDCGAGTDDPEPDPLDTFIACENI